MRRIIRVAAGLGTAAAVAVAGLAAADAADGPPQRERVVALAHGDDRLPSTTATDWVTYADHVVVVSATSEQPVPPTRTDVERGEGLMGRKVGLEVQNVLWSRPDAARPAPEAWEYNATGWTFTDGNLDNPTVLAMEGRPRIEPGHRYILAIAWQGPRCAEGDAPEPGRWMGLGEGSELPFDGGVIGQGELQGEVRTVAEARALAADAGPNAGLKEDMVGRGADDLAAALKAAAPGQKQQFAPQPTAACD
uniref:hypothetical protein n=1 Tax=Nonomuraea pusilla TaxID=46177 RepID=UPI000ACCE85C|nr:hypothetical protein [Nonomuraea pusilla]